MLDKMLEEVNSASVHSVHSNYIDLIGDKLFKNLRLKMSCCVYFVLIGFNCLQIKYQE